MLVMISHHLIDCKRNNDSYLYSLYLHIMCIVYMKQIVIAIQHTMHDDAIIYMQGWGSLHMKQYFESSDLSCTVFKSSVLSITYLG